MMKLASSKITWLLGEWHNGNASALDRLIPLIKNQLHQLADQYMRRERQNHTLQATALVNEAYLRLLEQREVKWQNRTHFFAIAAQMMRRILIDYAKTQQRVKRGGKAQKLSLDEVLISVAPQDIDLLLLDSALHKLALIDARKSQVIEMRYFGGLSLEEIAQLLNISINTISRDWAMAKAWLRREIEGQGRELG